MLVTAHTNKNNIITTKEKDSIKAGLLGRKIDARYEKSYMHRANS